MSKKGSSYIEVISTPQALILLVLILVIFGIVFLALSAKSSLDKSAYLTSEDLKLLNYLKTPITFNAQETTMGEFIISANEDISKRQFLENELLNIIPLTLEMNSTKEILILEIKFPDSQIINSKTYSHKDKFEVSSISLPVQNPDEKINIILYAGKLIEIPEYNLPEYHENP